MTRNLRAEANVARSLIRAGLLFNAFAATQADGQLITLFQVPFGPPESPVDVYAYLSGTLFVAQAACIVAGDPAMRSSVYESATRVPLVRIARDKSQDVADLHWVEAFSVVADADWHLADPIAHPVHAVSAAVRGLQREFADNVTFPAAPRLRLLGGERFSATIDQVAASD